MSNLTLRDIAHALNLSVSTVSKALRDSYEIGIETKSRVLAYAKAHGYRPNLAAKSLKEGKSGSIGVVVCSIDNSFVSQMLDGIDQACNLAGYDLIIMQSKESVEKEKSCIAQLKARGVEGILISPSAETSDFSHLQTLQQSGIPLVLFDRLSNEIPTYQVGADNIMGAYQATKHLIENGYSDIAFLNIASALSISSERYQGYQQALSDTGIPINKDYIRYVDCTSHDVMLSEIRRALQKFTRLPVPPTALITATEQLSLYCLPILKELLLQLPQDIAVVGFSNTHLADVFHTPLTTIYLPAYEIGQTAAHKLFDILNSNELDQNDHVETIRLAPTLYIRASSACQKT